MAVDSKTPRSKLVLSKWLPVAVLLLAAFLRFQKPDLVSVTNSTAIQDLTASEALSFDGWNWILAGPPTEEIRSSALLPTLIAAAKVIWWHPLSGTILAIALNVAAVALFYRFCTLRFGAKAGTLGTLLLACSPWAVLYSRLLLPVGCLTFFSVLLLYLSMNWLEDNGRFHLSAATALAVALPQVHFTGVAGLIWFMCVLWMAKSNVWWPGVVLGVVAGTVVWLPWIRFQQVTEWNELSAWASQVWGGPGEHLVALRASLRNVFIMPAAALGLEHWFGGGPSSFNATRPYWLTAGSAIAGVVLALLMAVQLCRSLTEDRQSPERLLALWAIIPVGAGAVLRVGGNPDNLLISMPATMAVVAILVAKAGDALPSRLRWMPSAVLVTICGFQVATTVQFTEYVASETFQPAGAYQMSLRQRSATVDALVEDAADRPILLLGNFSGWYPAYQYLLTYRPVALVSVFNAKRDQVCYWIDEEQQSTDQPESSWLAGKERELNQRISEHVLTAPDWTIDQYWTVGPSHIYRMRFVNKQPLK